jgi:hypothetical protein
MTVDLLTVYSFTLRNLKITFSTFVWTSFGRVYAILLNTIFDSGKVLITYIFSIDVLCYRITVI